MVRIDVAGCGAAVNRSYFPALRQLALERHGDGGSLSIPSLESWWDGADHVGRYARPGAGEDSGWRRQLPPPPDLTHLSLLATESRCLLG